MILYTAGITALISYIVGMVTVITLQAWGFIKYYSKNTKETDRPVTVQKANGSPVEPTSPL